MTRVTYAGLAALGCGVVLGGACLLPLEGAPTSSSGTQGTGGHVGVTTGAGGATGTDGAAATSSTGAMTMCESGHADCNGDALDGCEIDTTSDVSNCSSCSNVCPPPANATAACVSGQCRGQCTGTFGDCTAQDGCETDLTLVTSCGACGNACPAGFNCIAGNCGCGFNDANCNDGAPAGTFQCLSTPGADLCKCGSTVCSYGQRCKADGVCG